MPTGYTSELDENPDLTTAKWVTANLSRAYGVCVTLRDGPYGLSDDEIEEHLKKAVGRSTSYHKRKIKKAKKTLGIIKDDPEAWNDLYESTVNRMQDYNKRGKEEAGITKLRHERVERELIILRDNTEDEMTRNIAKFGLSQLELVKRDREPYIQEIPSLEKFKVDKFASLNRDIEYHTKNMKEAHQREWERVHAYRKLRSEVARILEPQSLTSKARKQNG